MGDVKMLALIGAFLGWPLVLLTLAVASVLGSLRRARPDPGPPRRHEARAAFGTFLAIAAMLAAAGRRPHSGLVHGVL